MLIISGQNSYEHDWTGVNNTHRTLMQDTGRFDVRVTEDFDHGTLAMLKPPTVDDEIDQMMRDLKWGRFD